MNTEMKVGIFSSIGIMFFILAILLIGDFQFSKKDTLYILFSDVSGLPPKAPVKISGVDVGSVAKIEFYQGEARVLAKIRNDLKLYKNAKASVVSTGVIGSKYVDLTMGTSNYSLLESGDTIRGRPQYSMEVILDKVMSAVDNLMSTVDFLFTSGEDGNNGLSTIFANIESITTKLDNSLGKGGENIDSIVSNLNGLAITFRSVGEKFDSLMSEEEIDRIREVLLNFEDLSSNLKMLSEDLRDGKGVGGLLADEKLSVNIKDTLTNLKEASVKAKELMNNVSPPKTEWQGSIDYNIDNDLFRIGSSVIINKDKKKYYHVGVHNITDSNSPLYDTGDHRSNSVSLLVGRNMKKYFLYGGLLKSSGGMGAGLNLFKDKIKLNIDAYRFNRTSLVNKKAWLDFVTSFSLSKWTSLKFKAEDMLEDMTLGVALGINFSAKSTTQDLKVKGK